MPTLDLDTRAVERILAAPGGPLVRGLERAARRVANQAQINLRVGANSAVDSGALAASIEWEIRVDGTRVRAIVYTDSDHAMFVHQGTGVAGAESGKAAPGGPQPSGRMIRPKRGRFLRFEPGPSTPPGRVASDGFVYAREVRGIPARPFLTDALATLTAGDLAGG